MEKCKSSNFFKSDCIHSFLHVSVFTIVLQLMDIHSNPTFDLGSFIYSVGNKDGSDWGRRYLSNLDILQSYELVASASQPIGNEIAGFDKEMCNASINGSACLKAVENICGESDFCYRGLSAVFDHPEPKVSGEGTECAS